MSQAATLGSPMLMSESLDDAPLLLAHLQRIGIQRLIDQQIATPPGALSAGWAATIWLVHVLSQSGRHVRHVRSWVGSHPETLAWMVGRPVRAGDLTDARLRDLLRLFADDSFWDPFEAALNQQLVRAYRIQSSHVRLRQTSGLWYITAEGVLQFDYSRRWWPGAMQVQTTLATAEAIGLPLAALIAERSEPHATVAEAIARAHTALPRRPLLYIGHGEISAPAVRGLIQSGGEQYLCQLTGAEALAELQIALASPQGEQAGGDIYERVAVVEEPGDERALVWRERRLLVRSHRQATEQETELQARLARAERDLAALNERRRGKRRPRTLAAMRETADAVLAEHGVSGLLELSFDELVDQRTVRRYRGRPTTTRVEHAVSVGARVDEAALAAARSRLGWQVYATNCSSDQLAADQAVRLIGEAHSSFDRLRGRPLSLMPGVVQRPDQIRGLVRLLTLALRSLVLLDLAMQQRAGDLPLLEWQRGGTAAQATPTGERLLEAFHDLNLTIVGNGHERHYHITALSALQRRMLDLLALPPDAYHVSLV